MALFQARSQLPCDPGAHRRSSPRPACGLSMPARSAASAARDYLAGHYARPVFLAEVARQACLSPFYFNRLFTQSSNHSVTEICFEVGYESLGSFSTRFSSLTGLSPATFRGEARRTFGGFGVRWPLYYIPGCFQRVVLAEHQAF